MSQTQAPNQTAVKLNRFYLLIIIAMGIYITFLQACNGSNKSVAGLDEYQKTDLIVMKVPRLTVKYKPVPVEVIVPGPEIIDSIPYTDSTYCKELAIDHFTTRTYNDTVKGDTCDLYVKARVHNNQIDSVQLGYKLNIPLVTVQPFKSRVQVFVAGNIGAGITIPTKQVNGFCAGAEFMIKDKRNYLYGAGVTWNTDGNMYVTAKFGLMLSFPKLRRR
jgi:hypothetical protein